MRKLIAAINMTLDGYCDHTAGIPDDEIHHHYADLLSQAGVILYGRITYQLMEFWRPIATHPTGNAAMDRFAVVMNNTSKIVFSRTIKSLDWDSATLAHRNPEEVVEELKRSPGKDIYVGSPGLIATLTQLKLIDEYQICIHPVLAGGGMSLFKNAGSHMFLNLIKSKTFNNGAVILYYRPATDNPLLH